MVKSFGVPEADVGKWAGLCSAMFSISQAVVGVPWGRISDVYGRKPAMLVGLTTTMITTLLWGFSTGLPMAIFARALAGAGNGNVGIIRTMVAEMVPFKELQPRAFSWMPLIWNVGSIFGPSLGGTLANPYNVKPGEIVDHPNLFQAYPYALPNIVSACFFAFGITVGILFLEETLERSQGRRDWGLRLGDKLVASVQSAIQSLKIALRRSKREPQSDDRETEPLIKLHTDEEHDAGDSRESAKEQFSRPTVREVLTKQSILNLAAYTFIAMHSMAFDQLLPVFLAYPSIPSGSPFTTPPGTNGNPLKFAGGFALDHFRIGFISTCYGVFGMLVQFFVFPPVARKLGILPCLKISACGFPIVYLLIPFTALLPTEKSQIATAFVLIVFKCFCGIFAFPCSTILLTNSASSLRVLGTLNGLATSVAAVGRACGPALGGAMFTVGVKAGFVIAPWWLFALVALVGAIPVFYLVEGEGFGGDDMVSDDEDDNELDRENLQFEALEGEAEATGDAGPFLMPLPEYAGDEDDEEAYGGVANLMSRTATSSSLTLDDDAVQGITPRNAQSSSGSPALSRRNSVRVMRRTSMPIGMGEGISRRYSSNLGQSFSSAGSYAGH